MPEEMTREEIDEIKGRSDSQMWKDWVEFVAKARKEGLGADSADELRDIFGNVIEIPAS